MAINSDVLKALIETKLQEKLGDKYVQNDTTTSCLLAVAEAVVEHIKAKEEVTATSTSAEDVAFWAWMNNFAAAWTAWIPIPGPGTDGGAALKLLMASVFASGSLPTKIVSKAAEGDVS